MLNTIVVEGKVTREPLFTDKGDYTLLSYTIENISGTKDAKCYFRVAHWGDDAVKNKDIIKKDSIIKVKGRVKWDTYKDKEGNPKNSIGIMPELINVSE